MKRYLLTNEMEYNFLRSYEEYTALSLHFKSDKYDFFKYKGKVKYSKKLNKQKEYFFRRLTKKHTREELLSFFAMKFFENPKYWIFSENADIVLKELQNHTKKYSSIQHTLKMEMSEYLNKEGIIDADNPKKEFEMHFSSRSSSLPIVLQRYLSGDVSVELLLLLNQCFNLFEKWGRSLQNDFLWKQYKNKFEKIQPFWNFFVDIDTKKFVYYIINKLS